MHNTFADAIINDCLHLHLQLRMFVRLSSNRESLYVHTPTASLYGIPLPKSVRMTSTTFPQYNPGDSSKFL